MISLLAIYPQSCKCKKGSDWLKKLADAKTIFKNKVFRDWSIIYKSYLLDRNKIIIEDINNA